MGCDGLMITPKESSPHMHLKKKKKEWGEKKGHDPIFKRPQHRFFLELDF